MTIKKYRRGAAYSYTFGMAPTIELIKYRRDTVQKIYVHPEYIARDERYDIYKFCNMQGLACECNKRIFDRLSAKENIFVIGVFNKFQNMVSAYEPHIVLVHPGDAGNLGTIIRTGIGFDFNDFVIISPGVDFFEPRVLRSSMGAFFCCRFSCFDSFAAYKEKFPLHKSYAFMLDGKTDLKDIQNNSDELFSLVFGNEASGLPDDFRDYGQSVYIKHSQSIDSLNLSVAFGVAAYKFSRIQSKVRM